jgi:hypothetical protein
MTKNYKSVVVPVEVYEVIRKPDAYRELESYRLMSKKSKKSPVYSGGHQAWGRIFWGFVALVLLSVVVSILRAHFG